MPQRHAENIYAVLGPQKERFKPRTSELFAGTVIGILMMGGGAAMVFFPARSLVRRNFDLPFFAAEGESVMSISPPGPHTTAACWSAPGGSSQRSKLAPEISEKYKVLISTQQMKTAFNIVPTAIRTM